VDIQKENTTSLAPLGGGRLWREAQLARSNGWLRSNEAHPTLAIWSRWRKTGDWDGLDTPLRSEAWNKGFFGIRGTATNHFAGDGWWAWSIQLKNGDVSIGAVIDQWLADWNGMNGTVGEKLRAFLSRHPAAREMMNEANSSRAMCIPDLPYSRSVRLAMASSSSATPRHSSTRFTALEWTGSRSHPAPRSNSSSNAAAEAPEPLVEKHNCDFGTSYQRMFEALDRDR
jgi:hypothetical protein